MYLKKHLTLAAIVLAASLSIRSGCHPNNSATTPPRVDEYPMANFLDTARYLDILPDENSSPAAFGYAFVSSKKGVLWAIGCKMLLPNNLTDSFTICLWDDSTHQLLLSKRMRYTDSSRFGMLDLTPTRETVPLKANYKYLISISRIYGFSYMMPCYLMAYTAWGPFNVLPLASGHITFLYERIAGGDATTAPVFPTEIVDAKFAINGFLDIGFYATEY